MKGISNFQSNWLLETKVALSGFYVQKKELSHDCMDHDPEL